MDYWIINKKNDLIWFTGSAAFAYLLIASFWVLNDWLSIPQVLAFTAVYFVFSFVFDGTHAFATYSRTYLDKDFWANNKPMLLGSLLLFAVGPALIFLGYAVAGEEQSRAIYIVMEKFFFTFAYYHLIRQHWGILALYRRKANETDASSYWSDATLLAAATLYPYLYLVVFNPKPILLGAGAPIEASTWHYTFLISLALLGFSFIVYTALRVYRRDDLSLVVSRNMTYIFAASSLLLLLYNHEQLEIFLRGLMKLNLAIIGIAVLAFVYLAIKRAYPWSKMLFMLTVLLVHNTIPYLSESFILIFMALTIFHNVQYHRIVWFHNQNRYNKDEDKKKFGIASKLAGSLVLYAVVALLWNMFSTVPRYVMLGAFDTQLLLYFLAAFFMGFPFHHYVLDALIWKNRGNKKLQNSLKV